MMGAYQMNVWFESHATSLDNEAGIASGHFDIELSQLGREQAVALSTRYRGRDVAAVYTSDLRRAVQTAAIAFPMPVISDRRLRECDYGTWTRRPVKELDAARLRFVDLPFPGGESYHDVVVRVRDFLAELPSTSREIIIIGHRATWYSLEHLLRGRDLHEVIAAPWHWQPGWNYRF
jgi:broad specificity phosphatase PhoE